MPVATSCKASYSINFWLVVTALAMSYKSSCTNSYKHLKEIKRLKELPQKVRIGVTWLSVLSAAVLLTLHLFQVEVLQSKADFDLANWQNCLSNAHAVTITSKVNHLWESKHWGMYTSDKVPFICSCIIQQDKSLDFSLIWTVRCHNRQGHYSLRLISHMETCGVVQKMCTFHG